MVEEEQMKKAKKTSLPYRPLHEDIAMGIALLEATLNDPRMTDDDLTDQVKFVVNTYATPISEAQAAGVRLLLDSIYASRPRSAFSLVKGGKR
jgi:hypothetical protein